MRLDHHLKSNSGHGCHEAWAATTTTTVLLLLHVLVSVPMPSHPIQKLHDPIKESWDQFINRVACDAQTAEQNRPRLATVATQPSFLLQEIGKCTMALLKGNFTLLLDSHAPAIRKGVAKISGSASARGWHAPPGAPNSIPLALSRSKTQSVVDPTLSRTWAFLPSPGYTSRKESVKKWQ